MKTFITQFMKARGLTVPNEEDVLELSKQWEKLQLQKNEFDGKLLKDNDIFYTYRRL